ncbi:MAG: DNA polymerase [Pyrinomonadaceae bacterium]
MKVIRVKAKDVPAMVRDLRSRRSIGFDTETGGFDPYHNELRLLQFSPSPDKAYVVDLRDFKRPGSNDKLRAVRDLLADPEIEKIGHNLKFDAKFVKHHLGVDLGGIYDTFICSQIVSCGQKYDNNGNKLRHGLGVVAERLLGREIDKTEQRSDWTVDELSDSQIEYAARDVTVLHELRDVLDRKLSARHLQTVARLENDIVMAMAQLELNGFYLDASRWRQQLRTVERKIAREAAELQTMLSGGNRQMGLFGAIEIDLGSVQQVAECLKGLGVPVPKTETGRDTTKEDQLEPFRHQFPVVDKLMEWRGLSKQLTSYGENILDLINPATGRIHADFGQIEAGSGRMRCGNPNLQNVPAGDEYRSCFGAQGDDRTLVIADYSQIELRVMAELSEDAAMIRSFNSGYDYHTATAMEVFGLTSPDEVSAEQRTFAKRINFGIGYGMGPGRFARMTGMTFDASKAFFETFFSKLSGLDGWLKSQRYTGLKLRYVKTLSGRTVDLRFDRRDEGQRKAAERLATNIPVQGSAADIFKRGLKLTHDAFRGTSARIVNLVHDEVVVECDKSEAEDIKVRLETALRAAGEEYVRLVPIKVDAKLTEVWAK